MFYSRSSRVGKACRLWLAPAQHVLFSIPAGADKHAGQGKLLPQMLYSHSGRVGRACWLWLAPAPDALFSIRQGRKSLPDLVGSCPKCSIPIPAGLAELAGSGWLLPQMLYSHSGRVGRACWLRLAPAPQALFSIPAGLPGLAGFSFIHPPRSPEERILVESFLRSHHQDLPKRDFQWRRLVQGIDISRPVQGIRTPRKAAL